MLFGDEVGGNGGSRFRFENFQSGALLQKFAFWADDSSLIGVSCRLTDGSEHVAGSTTWGQSAGFEFQPGERISRLSLWGNGIGTRAGWVEFDTNLGRKFSFGMTKWGRQTEYHIEVGSGICAGIFGMAGNEIDSLGFLMVKPLESARITDVQYPLAAFDNFYQSSKETIDVTHNNDSNVAETFSKSASYTHTETDTFTVTGSVRTSLEYMMEWNFQVTVPVFRAGTTHGTKST
jgi:hypothetical protein